MALNNNLENILRKEKQVDNFIEMYSQIRKKRPDYAEVLGALFEAASYLNPDNVDDYSTYMVIGGYGVLLNILKKSKELYESNKLEKYSPEKIIASWRGSHDIDLISSEKTEKNLPYILFNQQKSSNHYLVNTKKYKFNYVGPFKRKDSKGVPGDVYIIPYGKKIKIANAEFERNKNGSFDSKIVNIYGINMFTPKVSRLIKSKMTSFDPKKSATQNYEELKQKRQRDLGDIINVINSSDSKLDIKEFSSNEREFLDYAYKNGQKVSEEIFFKDIYADNNMRILWQK
jgi:hypothetical protein